MPEPSKVKPTPAADHANYLAVLKDAEAEGVIYVTPDQFRDIAEFAGWHPQTIRTFLEPPLFLESFLIGKRAYRLLDAAD